MPRTSPSFVTDPVVTRTNQGSANTVIDEPIDDTTSAPTTALIWVELTLLIPSVGTEQLSHRPARASRVQALLSADPRGAARQDGRDGWDHESMVDVGRLRTRRRRPPTEC